MIFIERIHQEFKLRYNKLNSNHNLDLPAAYIDDIANRAIREYVDIFATGNNAKNYKVGFEVTQQRIDMLSNLVVPNKTLTPIDIDSSNTDYDIYEFDLNFLDPEYYHHVRSYVKTDCGNASVTIKQHDDLNSLLSYEFTKPSSIWGRTYGRFAKNSNGSNTSLYVYSQSSVFSLTIEYIKRPQKVYSGGYNTLEYIHGDSNAYSIGDPTVNCELNEDYTHILVSIMIGIMAEILSDPIQVQLMKDNLINKY